MKLVQETISVPGYEKVVYGEAPEVGMKAIIAVHNTNRGPACGGLRMLPYASKEEALDDVLRLSKGMSYKSAVAGIGFGGGKSVLIGDPSRKTPEMLHAFGEFVDSFGGRYITAKDMNISTPDLAQVKTKTKYVLGIDGEPGSSGDPSPVTARGVYAAMEATVEQLTGSRSLKGLRVALQGIGYVGYDLAERLVAAGAQIWVCDPDAKRIERAKAQLKAHVVPLEGIYDVECDIFSPGARGAILNPSTLDRLKCKAIVGCANNQLLTAADGMRLHEKGILYAPDYVVNGGGIINIFVEYEGGYRLETALKMADGIYDTMKEVFKRAKASKKPPFVVADQLAEERLSARH